MALLQVVNVTKKFKGLTAVNNVSLHLEEGEILGLIGPNGAGKTTLFHLICGKYKPDEGAVFFQGENISGLKPEFICKRGIARTFQIVQPFGNLTLLENVVVAAFNRTRNYQKARSLAMEELAFVGMEEKANVRMKDLTFAGQKKVELARALATGPRLLFLDEVMSGLNPTEVREFIDLINKIRDRGISVFFIEHLMSAVMALSDRVVVMHHGELITAGRTEDIVRDERVIKAYLGGGGVEC